MPEQSAIWPVPDPDPDRSFSLPGLVLCRRVLPKRQALISGARHRALALAGLAGAVGWPEAATPDRSGGYALSLRRDRILAIDTAPLPEGWHAGSALAVSDVTHGYEIVEVSGAGALALLLTGTELDRNQASGSVARLWHGMAVLLYHWTGNDSFRLHVPSAGFEGFWGILTAQASGIAASRDAGTGGLDSFTARPGRAAGRVPPETTLQPPTETILTMEVPTR